MIVLYFKVTGDIKAKTESAIRPTASGVSNKLMLQDIFSIGKHDAENVSAGFKLQANTKGIVITVIVTGFEVVTALSVSVAFAVRL